MGMWHVVIIYKLKSFFSSDSILASSLGSKLYHNILGIFEVFNSVQVKPFCLKIGVINQKVPSLRVSAFPEWCHVSQHSVRLITKLPKLTDFQAFKMFNSWVTLGHLVKIRR